MVVNIEIEELPPSKRGRKKKYATADEARKAKLAQTKASNQRKKGGLVWKGATDPIFREQYARLKAEADKNGAGIFDYVKGFYDYGKKQVKQQVGNVKDLVVNPVGATKRIAGEAKDYVKAVVFGATKLPPNARNILHQYGDAKITEISVCRNPVGSLLTGALNAVSLGAFKKAFSKKPYDQLYHLYLWIKVEGTNITLEKNEVITMDIDASIRNGSDTMKVSLPTDRTLTLNEMMANTEAMMKQKFLTYSAKDNNCQDFVMAVLQSNGLGDDSIYSFVKQDTKSLFANDNFLRKVSNTLTDVGARANTAIFGAGYKESLGKIKSNDKVKMANKWITFVKAYANDKGISYSEALKDPNAKALYKKGGGFWGDFAKGFTKGFTGVLDIASAPIGLINPAAGLALGGLSAGTKALAGGGTKKGNRRKGQPAGARLAYDDLQGSGVPTNQEAYIADLYDSINLGANAGKRRSK